MSGEAIGPAIGSPILTVEQMRAVDRRAVEAGVPSLLLMENAGRGVAEVVRARLGGRGPSSGGPCHATVAVVCGAGNNGGDGFVAARHLSVAGVETRVLLAQPRDRVRGDATIMLGALRGAPNVSVSELGDCIDGERWRAALAGADVIVDAIFGTGLRAAIAGSAEAAVRAINDAAALRIAVDVPSGLDADTGRPTGTAVRADVTATMGAAKLGLLVDPDSGVGTCEVVPLGVAVAPPADLGPFAWGIDEGWVRSVLPRRPPGAHKGTAGHLVVVAGAPGKTGAAWLVARAALRGGAGLVTVASTAAGQVALDAKVIEAMTARYSEAPDDADAGSAASLAELLSRPHVRALALGPGIPTGPKMGTLVRDLAASLALPMVIDADGLNHLGDRAGEILRGAPAARVLTPHPGEMARLLGSSSSAVQANRVGVARDLARAARTVVVLKGARTVIADPDGTAVLSPLAEPALATGGTGDVLTGLIGALLVQGVAPLAAACAGVWLHGRAGGEAAGTYGTAGVVAGDLPDAVARLIARLVGRPA